MVDKAAVELENRSNATNATTPTATNPDEGRWSATGMDGVSTARLRSYPDGPLPATAGIFGSGSVELAWVDVARG